MIMLDLTQASEKGRLSPYSSVQLYCILHTHQILHNLFGPMKEGLKGKHNASDKKEKTSEMKWLKEVSKEFYEVKHCLLREMVTMLRSRDMIHWGPASFWFIILVPMSVITPALKKKALFFIHPNSNIYLNRTIYKWKWKRKVICTHENFIDHPKLRKTNNSNNNSNNNNDNNSSSNNNSNRRWKKKSTIKNKDGDSRITYVYWQLKNEIKKREVNRSMLTNRRIRAISHRPSESMSYERIIRLEICLKRKFNEVGSTEKMMHKVVGSGNWPPSLIMKRSQNRLHGPNHIKYGSISFVCFLFNGIPTLVDYLVPNPFDIPY